jgi:DNA-binding response OmpR family regulator
MFMSPVLTIKVVPMSEVPLDGPIPVREARPRIVLVVDDERIIADTLSIILTKSGFTVLTAYNGESALDMARISPPELLLSDVMLGPGIDGTELAIAMVQVLPECKVLLFSGHAATVDLLSKSRDLGYDFTLLVKPLHPADLLARIRDSFATRGLHRAVA